MMRQGRKKWISLALAAILLLTALTGCSSKKEQAQMAGGGGADSLNEQDIVILFTNDAHCGVEDDIGYAGLAAYKSYCKKRTPFTTLVDCGDAVQGGLLGTVSEGKNVVDIMNHVGYDLAVLGNHEFDYGMDRLGELMEQSNAQYLGCNITYSGKGTNALGGLKPYEIVQYGLTKVAFIGVTTPHTLTSSTPAYFQEDGKFVYQFNGGGAEQFYACVQGYIDECLQAGANYVVLLTHLGDTEEMSPYSSLDLIRNTHGAHAVLDGHSHSEISCYPVKDERGGTVLLSSAGTKLENIGQLTISRSGTLTTTLISRMDWSDEATAAYVDGIQAQYEEQMNTAVGSASVTLSGYTEDGIRLVRTRETTVGNFCADAYRTVAGADIGLINGGGVRADLAAGEITYADLINLNPFGNSLCMVEATGQEIADALEVAYRSVRSEYAEDGAAIGEDGGFLQISGLRLTVDTSVASTVTLDENGMLVSIGESRRVKNIMVQNADGAYEALDMTKVYTVASHDYLLKNGGGGHEIFSDNLFLIDGGMADYEALITYVTDKLGGTVGEEYTTVEGRITVL